MNPMSRVAAEDLRIPVRERESDEPETEGRPSERRTRKIIRMQCRDQLETCVADPRSAMTRRDVEGYMQHLQEEKLDDSQWNTEEEKTRAVQKMAGEWARDFIRKAQDVGDLSLRLIEEAEGKKWILGSTADKWRKKLKDEKSTGLQKANFIEKVLPKWQRSWEQLAKDSGTVKRLEKAFGMNREQALKEEKLKKFHDPKFWNGEMSFSERREIVTEAKAFLESLQGRRAKGEQDPIVRSIIANRKDLRERMKNVVAVPEIQSIIWGMLLKTFGTKEKPTKSADIHQAFLQDLLRNWPRIQKFARLEERRKMEGTPRSFHFVHFSVFFSDWNSAKQDAYLEEGQNRFTDISKERDAFLRIRHALDTQDWEEAEGLLAGERKLMGEMTPEDQAKLHSLEEFLRTHRPKQSKNEGKEKQPTDQELVDQMRSLMTMIPASQRRLHEECLRRGYRTFWTNCTAWYNLVWCEQHLWWNPTLQMHKEEEARECTPDYIDHGHRRGFEANKLQGTTNKIAAVREQKDKGEPQWTFIGGESWETAADLCQKQQDNRRWWYYTSFIPRDVPYSQHRYVVKSVHPQMKRLARKMEERGILFTQNGPVQHGPTGTAKSIPTPSVN